MSNEVRRRTILETHGDEADIAVRQLMVVLKWTADVDLDILAFYVTEDGREGGVFSENYPGGDQGDVNHFPFIELAGDTREGQAASEKQEVLQISEVGDMAEIYIVAMNYSDAVANVPSAFHEYDGVVVVMNERWETVEVPLNSTEKGHVAVICKIDNTRPQMSPRLVNLNKVMDFKDFMTTIPGANMFVRLKLSG
jgi:uncharacterized protein involved in tellurium resistance